MKTAISFSFILPSSSLFTNVLTHIVIWKYRADVEVEVRDEHVRLLKSLKDKIPQVQSLFVGADVLRLPRSFDTGLVAMFHDRAALDAYTIHPEHITVAGLGRTISEQVASVDFEDQVIESTIK